MSLLWFCTFILGVSMFTPISSFSLSIDYFEHAFPGAQMAVKVTVCYEMAFVAFQLLCHLTDGKLPLSRAARIELRHLAVAALMAFIIVWERVINGTGPPPDHSPAILLAAVTVTGMLDGICVGAVFGEAAILGPSLAHALVAGTAGVMPLLASLRIIFKAALPPTPEGLRLSITFYFAAAVAVMLAGFVCYCVVVSSAVADVTNGAENSKYIDDLTTLPLVPTLHSYHPSYGHDHGHGDQTLHKHGSGLQPAALRSMSSLIRTVTPEESSLTQRADSGKEPGDRRGLVKQTLTPMRNTLLRTVTAEEDSLTDDGEEEQGGRRGAVKRTLTPTRNTLLRTVTPEEDCLMRTTIPSGSEYCPPDLPEYKPPLVPEYKPPLVPEYRPPLVPEYRPPIVPEYRAPIFGGGGLGRAITAPEHNLVRAAAAAGGNGLLPPISATGSFVPAKPHRGIGGLLRTGTVDAAALPGLLRQITPDVSAITAALARTTSSELAWRLPSSMRGSSLLVRHVHSHLPSNDLRVGSIAGAAAGSMLHRQGTLPAGFDWGNELPNRGAKDAGTPLAKTSTHSNNPFKRSSMPVYPSRFHRKSLDLEAAAVHDKDAFNWPPAVLAAAAAAGTAAGTAPGAASHPAVSAGSGSLRSPRHQQQHNVPPGANSGNSFQSGSTGISDWAAGRDQGRLLPVPASVCSNSMVSLAAAGDRLDSIRSDFSVTDKQLRTAMANGETDELLNHMINLAHANIPLEAKYFAEGNSVWRANWLTIKDNKWYVLAIILTYTCNYGLFPATFAYMQPYPALGSWYSLLLVTIYGIGDLIGKLLPVWKPRRPQVTAMAISVIRLVLFFVAFALALLFKAGPGFYFPAVFLLSLTAWYEALIFSLACEGHHPDDAYQVESLLAIQLDVGIGLGSVISLAWSAGPWAAVVASGAPVAHG